MFRTHSKTGNFVQHSEHLRRAGFRKPSITITATLSSNLNSETDISQHPLSSHHTLPIPSFSSRPAPSSAVPVPSRSASLSRRRYSIPSIAPVFVQASRQRTAAWSFNSHNDTLKAADRNSYSFTKRNIAELKAQFLQESRSMSSTRNRRTSFGEKTASLNSRTEGRRRSNTYGSTEAAFSKVKEGRSRSGSSNVEANIRTSHTNILIIHPDSPTPEASMFATKNAMIPTKEEIQPGFDSRSSMESAGMASAKRELSPGDYAVTPRVVDEDFHLPSSKADSELLEKSSRGERASTKITAATSQAGATFSTTTAETISPSISSRLDAADRAQRNQRMLARRRSSISSMASGMVAAEISANARRQSLLVDDSDANEETTDDQITEIDCSLLINYLVLVKDNPEVYRMQEASERRAFSKDIMSTPALSNMMAQAALYERRNHGFAGGESAAESAVIHAAYDVCAPVLQRAANMTAGGTGGDTKKSQSIFKVRSVGGEFKKTDLLRATKAAVREYLKGMNTAQILRARETAIAACDEEGGSMTHWWATHNNCAYLRRRTTSMPQDYTPEQRH